MELLLTFEELNCTIALDSVPVNPSDAIFEDISYVATPFENVGSMYTNAVLCRLTDPLAIYYAPSGSGSTTPFHTSNSSRFPPMSVTST